MLGLPQTTEVKKIIPKRALYSKFQMNTAEQKEFDAAIRQMTIVNEISLRTIPALQKKEQEKAVYVLAVQLKQEGCAERLLQRLCRLIDQRLLLALCYEDKLQLALYFDNRILLNEFMPVAEQKVNLQGTSLNDIWEHLAGAINATCRAYTCFRDCQCRQAGRSRSTDSSADEENVCGKAGTQKTDLA